MATIISMLLHAWRLRRRRRPSKGASIPSYAELRATFGYLEHLVRVGAIPQGMAERFLPGRTATRLFAPWWSYVERSSYRSGYTFGIGNAKKYRLRRAPLEARVEDEFSALDLYELAPSPTGASIHHRDVADVAAGLMRRASGIERDRRRKEAIEHYELAIDRATEAGDPSLELKAMFGLQSVEPQRRWPRRQVAGLVDRIQSPAYTTLKDRIVTRLAA